MEQLWQRLEGLASLVPSGQPFDPDAVAQLEQLVGRLHDEMQRDQVALAQETRKTAIRLALGQWPGSRLDGAFLPTPSRAFVEVTADASILKQARLLLYAWEKRLPKVEPRKVALLGDSQSFGTVASLRALDQGNYGQVSDKAVIGINTEQFLAWLDLPEAAEVVAGKQLLVLQIGGNDISSGVDPQVTIQRIQTIVEKMSRRAPGARLVLGEIPVRWRALEQKLGRETARARQKDLETVNAWIARLCDGAPNIDLFPVNSVIGCEDDSVSATVLHPVDQTDTPPNTQRREYWRDYTDVHLNQAGYDALAKRIIRRYLSAPNEPPNKR